MFWRKQRLKPTRLSFCSFLPPICAMKLECDTASWGRRVVMIALVRGHFVPCERDSSTRRARRRQVEARVPWPYQSSYHYNTSSFPPLLAVSAAWSASSSNRIVFAGRSVMGFSLQSLLYARTSVYRRCISRDRSPRAHSRGEKALTLRMRFLRAHRK